MMTFLPADYILGGLTVVMAVTGLFRGFSGTLAFVLAVVGASATATFGWGYSETLTEVVWMRAAGVLVTALLTFGIVRMLVKKTVNGLLAQPSDALLGMLIGALFGVALVVLWAWSGMYLEYSSLARQVAAYL